MYNNLKCKFYGSNRINKRGKQKYNGKQRYLCRKARSRKMIGLPNHFNLLVCEVPTEEVKMKIENHSPLEGESNEQGFSEVRLVGGLKIMKNLELRIKNLPSAELQRN